MPFGLEYWPLQAMGWGIDGMVGTGEWVASWPGAVSILPQISGLALILIVLGGLWLCLWHTQDRAFGWVIAACGLSPFHRPPVPSTDGARPIHQGPPRPRKVID